MSQCARVLHYLNMNVVWINSTRNHTVERRQNSFKFVRANISPSSSCVRQYVNKYEYVMLVLFTFRPIYSDANGACTPKPIILWLAVDATVTATAATRSAASHFGNIPIYFLFYIHFLSLGTLQSTNTL